VCEDTRAWLRGLFTSLATELGARDPERLGSRLTLLYDGATVGASMDGRETAAAEARELADELITASLRP